MKVGIIGGGASGSLCAIILKKINANIDVTILEQNDRILKKVLQTGNGMCNLDNINSNKVNNYNTKLIEQLINKYDCNYVRKLFLDLGLLTMVDEEGRVYPYSRKASNVIDILLNNLKINNCQIKTNICIDNIKKRNNKYILNNDDSLEFDELVVSCGGQASISNNSIYNLKKLLIPFNLKWIDNNPSLSALKTKESVKALSGIRMKANIKYLVKEKDWVLKEERKGEVLYKDEGLSGIVVLELSRNFNKNYPNKVVIDFISDYSENQIVQIIENSYHNFVSLGDCLIGIVPKMVALDIIKKSNNDIRKIAYLLKHMEYNIVDTYGYNQAQVMRGGVALENVNLDSFEVKSSKGLYIIGESLDVDGTCGGFNLHFAWASAIACARNIVKNME